MKRMFMVLALLALTATAALAQGEGSSIGMFADPSATVCDASVALYATTTVYFIAVLNGELIPSISAVQFEVSNWPGTAGQGLITYGWNTPLVIGTPDTDMALAFNPPLTAPLAFLGQVDFFALNAAWIGNDYEMAVIGSYTAPLPIVVRFSDALEIDVPGTHFTFNCTGDCPCETATAESSWGSVKALY
jgi:hypothetical protein